MPHSPALSRLRVPYCLRAGLVALLTLTAGTSGRAAEPATSPTAPQVVVSIKPLHALAASLMQGVGQPYLLVRGSDNPHSFTLRPSDAGVLARADLVVWMGGTVEPSLTKPLTTLPDHARVLSLLTAPGIQVLPARAAGLWADAGAPGDAAPRDAAAHADRAAHGEDALGGPDGHVWLNPENAKAMAVAMAAAMTTVDPADAPRFQANLAALLARLDALDRDLDARLAPVRDRPFIESSVSHG